MTSRSLEYRHRRFKVTSNLHHHGRLIYLSTAHICQNLRRHIPESVCMQIDDHQISSYFGTCYLVCVCVCVCFYIKQYVIITEMVNSSLCRQVMPPVCYKQFIIFVQTISVQFPVTAVQDFRIFTYKGIMPAVFSLLSI